jgi:hypothetical protein
MPSLEPPFPTFLIIGAQKSATRWLRSNLGLHPDIYTVSRELSFFGSPKRFQGLGTDWYREQFADWGGAPIIGEATPGYMMYRHRPRQVAPRIHETIPDVKLIAILRNPIDRAQSAMVHHMKHGRIPPDARLLDVVSRQPPEREWMGLIAGGWYGQSLAPYVSIFGDSLLVLKHDDVKTDPVGVYRRALEHVGASPDFVPDELQEVVFSNQEGRTEGPPPLTFEERLEMWEYFRNDMRRLEKLLDFDISDWRPRAPKPEREPDEDRPARVAGTQALPERFVARFDSAMNWIAATIGEAEGRDEPAIREDVDELVHSMTKSASAMNRGPVDAPSGARAAESYAAVASAFRNAMLDREKLPGDIETSRGTMGGHLFVRLTLFEQLAQAWELAEELGDATPMTDDIVELAESVALIMNFDENDDTPTSRFAAYLRQNLAA